MADVRTMIEAMYAAFNRRDAEAVLATMREDVSWPKASEGGRVQGKDAIRAYWGRQWAEFDPRVEPVEMMEREDGVVEVRVHQVVKSLAGEVLADGEVVHTYTMVDGLVARMDMGSEADANDGATAAFSRR